MQVPLEVTFREITKTDHLEELITQLSHRLERFHGHLDSCRVAIEQTGAGPQTFREVRVRIDMTVPHGQELVVTRTSAGASTHDNIEGLVREAFHAAARRLRRLKELQHNQRTAQRGRRRLKQHLSPLSRRGTKTRYNTQSIAR